MSALKNRQFLLASRPHGLPNDSTFRLNTADVPAIKEGELLVRLNAWSLDPAMRGWITDRKSYMPPVPIDAVMYASATGVVIESKAEDFAVGDAIVGFYGWQEYTVVEAKTAKKLPAGVPTELFLGILGGTGLTAYFGLNEIGQPKEGEVVLVSGAAGATGSIVTQLAKLKGCYVVGIAGSEEKQKLLTSELGCDVAINYKGKSDAELRAAIEAACPKGIDVYFDNVGGITLEIALSLMNKFGRIVCCGSISAYNSTTPVHGPIGVPSALTVKSLTMRGFIVLDYSARFPEGIAYLSEQLQKGKLKSKDTIIEGFEKLPATFVSLFEGANTGKLIVRASKN